jgi:hypothetical protein
VAGCAAVKVRNVAPVRDQPLIFTPSSRIAISAAIHEMK